MDFKNFVLEVLNGKNKGNIFNLEADKITVGRRLAPGEKKKDWILIDDLSLARIHAFLLWDASKMLYKIVLKTSKFESVLINGKPVKEGYLYHLDKVQLGNVICRVWDGPVDKNIVFDDEKDDILLEDEDLDKPPSYSPPKSSNQSLHADKVYEDLTERATVNHGFVEHNGHNSNIKDKKKFLQKNEDLEIKPFSFFTANEENASESFSASQNDKKHKILGGRSDESKDKLTEFKPIDLTSAFKNEPANVLQKSISSKFNLERSAIDDIRSKRRVEDDSGYSSSSRSKRRVEDDSDYSSSSRSKRRVEDNSDSSSSRSKRRVEDDSDYSSSRSNRRVEDDSDLNSARFMRESRFMSALSIQGTTSDSGIVKARVKSKQDLNKKDDLVLSLPAFEHKTPEEEIDTEPFDVVLPYIEEHNSNKIKLNSNLSRDFIGKELFPKQEEPDSSLLPESILEHNSAKETLLSGYQNFLTSSVNDNKNFDIIQYRRVPLKHKPSSVKKIDKIQLPLKRSKENKSPLSSQSESLTLSNETSLPSNESVSNLIRDLSSSSSLTANSFENTSLSEDFISAKTTVKQIQEVKKQDIHTENEKSDNKANIVNFLGSKEPSVLPSFTGKKKRVESETFDKDAASANFGLSLPELIIPEATASINDSSSIDLPTLEQDSSSKPTEPVSASLADSAPSLFSNLPSLKKELSSKPTEPVSASLADSAPSLFSNLPTLEQDSSSKPSEPVSASLADSAPSFEQLNDTHIKDDKHFDLQPLVDSHDSKDSDNMATNFKSKPLKNLNQRFGTLTKESKRNEKNAEKQESLSSEDLNFENKKKSRSFRSGNIRFAGDNVFRKTVMSSAGFTNAVDSDLKISDDEMEKFLEVIEQSREEDTLPSEDSVFDVLNNAKSASVSDTGKANLFGPASSIDLPLVNYKINPKQKQRQKTTEKTYDIDKKISSKSEACLDDGKNIKTDTDTNIKDDINFKAPSDPVTSISLPPLEESGGEVVESSKSEGKPKKPYFGAFDILIDDYQEPISSSDSIDASSKINDSLFDWSYEVSSDKKSLSSAVGEPSDKKDAISVFFGEPDIPDVELPDFSDWTLHFVKMPGINNFEYFDLNKDEIIIGRSGAVDLTLKDIALADRHVKLYMADGQLYLQKLDRKKQIFINGSPLISSASRLLKEGDRIQLSDLTVFEVKRKTKG